MSHIDFKKLFKVIPNRLRKHKPRSFWDHCLKAQDILAMLGEIPVLDELTASFACSQIHPRPRLEDK